MTMVSEASADESLSSAPILRDYLIDGLAQGCSIPEAAMLCGLSPERGASMLQEPDVQRAVRNSLARLTDIVRMMDMAAYYAQPVDSNVVDLWAWHALRNPERGARDGAGR
jgi:hypothetical protein